MSDLPTTTVHSARYGTNWWICRACRGRNPVAHALCRCGYRRPRVRKGLTR
jgi:ribosomal protein L40E